MSARKNATRKSISRRLGEALDVAVAIMSPERGARRLAMRAIVDQVRDRETRRRAAPVLSTHEAAESNRLRAKRWIGSHLSPDSALEEDLESMRNRARELHTNDATGGAVDVRVNNVVGCGHKLQPKIKALAAIGLEAEAAAALNSQIDELFVDWSARCDPELRWPLWSQHRLAQRHQGVEGEAITVLSDSGGLDVDGSERVVPLVVEVVDPARLATPALKAGDPLVRMGVERSKKGKVIAYWIRRSTPGDTHQVDAKFDRVAAWRVQHVFERMAAGVSRGKPWLHRVTNRVKDAADLDEAAVIAAQVEACSTAFVTSPVGATRAAIGAGTGTDTAGNRLQELEPGAVDYLEPGEEVTFNAPQKAGGMYSDFQEWAHRRIATGLNFPYELLVKNWGGLSFATGRLSLADGRVDFTCRQALDRDLWLKPIYHRFLDELVLFGKVDIDPRDYEAHRAHFRRHAWTPPAWAYVINPKQEIDAAVAAIAANLRTKRDYVESTGFALDDVFDERAAEIAREASLNITPAPAAGAAPPPAAAAEPDDPEADELADELEAATDEA